MFSYVNYASEFMTDFNLQSFKDIKEKCLLLCTSKFESKFNITILNEESEENAVVAILILKDCKIDFPNADMPIKSYNAKPGDLFSFHCSTDFIVDLNNILKFSFKYLKEPKKHGDGSKIFEITTKLEDVYKINVHAETLEEAIDCAKKIDIAYWEHLELYPEAKESRKITRYSKWHFFEGKEK